jgi:serine/threonine-protein kinase
MTTGDDDTLSAPPPCGAGEAVRQPDAGIPLGSRVGDYVVLGFLGAGAHGGVYLAEHRVAGHRAAVKVLHRESAESSEITARFVREARAVNQVRHPGIVDIYDIGTLPDGRPFCVMELLLGRTLQALLEERAPLLPAEAVACMAPVCEALQAAHDAGVVHRDVKASNVMLLSEGNAPQVKLLDFGVAKLLEASAVGLTTQGQRIGTPASMSPEQIRGGPIDRRADVYALGVLLHRMLTGRQPFEAADPAEVERMHLEAVPPRPSALAPVPPAFDAVVARCLEKDRERRWPSAMAVAEAARAALGSGPSAALRKVPAVAVHISVKPCGIADLEALTAQADVGDAAEAALRGAGFALTFGTAGTLLGVRLLAAEPEAARVVRAEAVTWARSLAAGLARPGVAVTVCVHADDAAVRDAAGGPEVTGGPICQIESWLPEGGPGFLATRAALAGLRG